MTQIHLQLLGFIETWFAQRTTDLYQVLQSLIFIIRCNLIVNGDCCNFLEYHNENVFNKQD
ncbi:hypothetical protein CXB77_11965 [Chromatium okenii]|uniref:Uncharacterized protein n=1 Tax=Chromatium okenii TaxID=61644 RepID=A0A2S7XMT1_9GAMM|nr:hypothetical protein CXB77_11965 [Chromatium okenii]